MFSIWRKKSNRLYITAHHLNNTLPFWVWQTWWSATPSKQRVYDCSEFILCFIFFGFFAAHWSVRFLWAGSHTQTTAVSHLNLWPEDCYKKIEAFFFFFHSILCFEVESLELVSKHKPGLPRNNKNQPRSNQHTLSEGRKLQDLSQGGPTVRFVICLLVNWSL